MTTQFSVWHTLVRKISKRKRGLLTLSGAAIIFGTFVVKEGKRDEMKEVVAEIQRAQSTFKIREDFGQTVRQIQDLRDEVEAPRDHSTPNSPITGDDRVSTAIRKMRDMQVNNYMALANTTNLFEELPERPSKVEDELQGLRNRFKSLKQDTEQFRTKVEQDLVKQAQKDFNLAVPSLTHDDEIELVNILKRSATLANDIHQVDVSVFRGAAYERTKSEESYGTYSQLSYFLYSAGWFLSLLGKLWFRVEAGAETE